jgi:hypothetical protein
MAGRHDGSLHYACRARTENFEKEKSMTSTRGPRLATSLLVSSCLLLAGLVAAQTSAGATRGCPDPATKSGLKGGYFSQLRVTNVSCRSGKKLVYAYYACRMKKGGRKASCSGRTINSLRCKEYRKPDLQSDTQVNARVTCTKGSKKVVHSYQQNLVGS